MRSKNLGKKYKKVDYNADTDYSRDQAEEFAHWYANNFEKLKTKIIYSYKWDDDTAQDTFLKIYDAVRYKGLKFDLDSLWYYLRSYHTNNLQRIEKLAKKRHSDIDDAYTIASHNDAPQVDPWEELKNDIVWYIDFEYGEKEAFIFLSYVELQPIGKAKLAEHLGLQYGEVSKILSTVIADISKRFSLKQQFE